MIETHKRRTEGPAMAAVGIAGDETGAAVGTVRGGGSRLGYEEAMGYEAQRTGASALHDREALLRLASKQGHKGDHEALLNTDSLRLLLMLACAKEMRMRRHALLSGQEAHRVSLEAMNALMVRGWVEIHGQFVELTQNGNGLVCALLELVRKGGVVS